MKENLNKALKKSKDKIINVLSPEMVIRHIPTKIEYTIRKVTIQDGEPTVLVYRYYSKDPNKKVFVRLTKKDFKDYEPV